MLVLVNVVLPAATVAATDPAVNVRVALVSARVGIAFPVDMVADPEGSFVESPRAGISFGKASYGIWHIFAASGISGRRSPSMAACIPILA